MPSIEFQNEIAALEEAVEYFKDIAYIHGSCEPDYCDEAELYPHAETISQCLPKLIAAYEDLFRLSMNLTEYVKAQQENMTPQGLYIPTAKLDVP